jgi:dipeptidyl-peptidase-4
MIKKYALTTLMIALTSAMAFAAGKNTGGKVDARCFDPLLKKVEGWNVYIEPKLLDANQCPNGVAAVKMLANHLQRLAILLPPEQLEKMRTIDLWIESGHPLKTMQYHTSAQWLKNNGYDPRLAKKVHIPRAEQLLSRNLLRNQPAVILHELSHAYHDQFLGNDDPRIIKAYNNAIAEGLYDKVMLCNGRMVRHYAMTNHREYFAEGTEAYFISNDFYPFVAAELKKHDPNLYALLAEIWGR